MKKLIIFCFFIPTLIYTQDNAKYSDYPISAVNIKDVIIQDNFWLPKIKLIQDTTIHYAFEKCEEEGRMQNFLVA
ncbi:MAG: glycoside hydrolase family 127 protein, partial [bacterium]